MSDHDLPFKTEYAKSSRSSCKLCKENIGQDSLRLAKMTQSPHFDGKIPNWFHYNCFFKKCKVKSEADISGFGALRWEDQQKIKGKLEGSVSKSSDVTNSPVADENSDLQVEYAKSNRSKCKLCKEQIDKDTVRLAKLMDPEPDSSAPRWLGPTPWWHHIECFIKHQDELGLESSVTAESFSGFTKLKKEDQDILKEKLGSSGKKKTSKGSKRKAAAQKSEVAIKKKKTEEEEKEEKALKGQSELLWKIRDELKRSCPTSVLREMLEENNQNSTGGESALLDRCADGMAFGQLDACPDCKEQGHFSFRSDGYACHGHLTGWTKCQYITKDPPRKAWKISIDLKEEVEYLEKYKYKKRKRIFPTVTAVASSKDVAAKSEKRSISSDKPLSNMKFVVIGKLSKSKGEVTKMIEDLGGQVVNKVNSSVTCCISSKAEVVKSSKKMKDAENADVPVVSEDYLNAVKGGGALLMISQHSIASWGNKGTSMVDAPPPPSKASSGKLKKAKSAGEEPVSKKIKLAVKGGAAVDPASGLEDTAHVLEEAGVVYNAVLGMVDVARGTNSYYKLQILQNDKGKGCSLFRSWGRVGTSIGGNKLEEYSKKDAVGAFCQLYGEKTGNDWSDRRNFVKKPNRFYPLEIDYGQDEEDLKSARSKISPGSKSKLHIKVQELVKMIFDVDMMKKTMIEFEIDLKKMPLGKLSRRQIENAYSVLSEAQQLLSNEGSATLMLDVSNRFYTLIPHDFGMKKPPLLDNTDLIKTKVAMLDSLIDIEVAYSLLKSVEGDEIMDPLDVEYKKLNTELEVLEQGTEEWKFIESYVKNTHAETHGQYSLDLIDVFKVSRHGESQRYKPFKELHNRRLLWHGSRTSNYAGILSQGLRIAPPEAPMTGYMFGKGVYFADMVSKSANYCRTTSSNNIGLMLLCETALGNMQELLQAKMITKPPKGKHSVKGCGRTGPDPKDDLVLKDGTIVPLGKGVNTGVKNSSLLYNEYIVYDVAQIEIKYLIKLEFKYKYSW